MKASAEYGRDDIESISKEVEGKDPEEVCVCVCVPYTYMYYVYTV